MDKRFILFLVLSVLVLVVSQKLFPPARQARSAASTAQSADSTRKLAQDTTHRLAHPDTQVVERGRAAALAETSPATAIAGPAAPAETVTVTTPRVVYRFSTLGAMPIGVNTRDYKALSPGGGTVQLVRAGSPLYRYDLIRGPRDTVHLDRVAFTVDSSLLHAGGAGSLTFHGASGGSAIAITYTFAPDSYVVRVKGAVQGGQGGQAMLMTIPFGLHSAETDTVDDEHHFAYVLKPRHDSPNSIAFSKLDTTVARMEAGPLTWIATKSKYFVVALLTDTTGTPFSSAVLRGIPHGKEVATSASATAVQPLGPNGEFAFEMYAGPQEWRRLVAVGRDFDEVNPYGGIFKGVVQPFATVIMRVLLWMHAHLTLSYGWVLIVFGVAVRIVLWPLNQSAMRAQLKLQRIQPELQALQKKYKTQPDKQQAEMMRLYKEHGMSPFSPLAGCLPLLIPMPVLYALYYVFLNTIEFRGVPFLWMADISQKDPYYILPIVMGISMFVLSWIGLRAAPPNQQAKTMAYIMPVFMTVLFYRFAAGLNLYYAVQNIAALPQQWLIAKERAKAVPAAVSGPAKGSASGSAGSAGPAG